MTERIQEEQVDMFGHSNINLSDVGDIIETDDSKSAESLKQLHSVIKLEIDKKKIDPDVAIALTLAICDNLGGFSTYLPKGRRLRSEIKKLKIWNEFTGNNIDELAKKYDVSNVYVYRVTAEMKARYIERTQHSLF